MPIDCARSTSGGKGNLGMFIERDPYICAAGIPTQQPDSKVGDCLEHYLLQDKVDALISDAIIPDPKPRPLPPLRRPIPLDMRFAGPYCNLAKLVNPPIKSKFQTLVDDFKDSTYTSYWKKKVGQVPDPVPMLPDGFDTYGTTFGKETPYHGRLYDIVMPKVPPPDKTPLSKRPGVQLDRHYTKPPFCPDLTYGYRSNVDKRGTYAKGCVTDRRITLGTSGRVIVDSIQARFQEGTQPKLGKVLAPNSNINNVPEGYCFGMLKPPDNLPECLTFCKINPDKEFFRKCFGHLNSLRKCLSKRFLPTFFNQFYLNLKYFDQSKTGWLPKRTVYDFCASKLIRFDSTLIEPLLAMWNAFDGSQIYYKTFVHVINYREPSPEIPKIEDIPSKCLNYVTTYMELSRTDKEVDDSLMAGVPSGRYFDLDYPVTPAYCCRADRSYYPHESDMKSCLSASVLTLMNVTHRDMFCPRERHVVRKVFSGAGEEFTDDKFDTIWNEAKKQHPEGLVCYETFRGALKNYANKSENDQAKSHPH